MSSQQDFLASHIPEPGSREAREMTATSGRIRSELYETSGQSTLLVKTCLASLRWHSTKCFLIWRGVITNQERLWFRLAPLAHRTGGTGFGFLPTPSGTSSHGKNHVVGRLDEWGGSSNPFRGTSLGKVRSPSFEAWMMGYPEGWLETEQTPSGTQSSPRSQK